MTPPPTDPHGPESPAIDAAVQDELDRRPNPWVLLAIVVVAAVVAVVLGVGWG